MFAYRTQVQVLMELNKICSQRESLLKRHDKLVKKEKSFITWLANLEGAAFRAGDMVMIENEDSPSFATVRYTKKDKRGMIWVYLTTTHGKKTRRVPRNLKKLGSI